MARNARFQCKGCVNKVTLNQLRSSGGICQYCKTPMHHDNWRKQGENLAGLLNISKEDDAEIHRIAEEVGFSANELIRAAVVSRLRTWQFEPSRAKDDLMLEKLYRV